MMLLLRFSTGEDWNGFMRSIIPDKEGCIMDPVYNVTSPWCFHDEDYPTCTEINGCGAGYSAFVYFYSFTLVVSFVILNLFVGVVLETFESSTEGQLFGFFRKSEIRLKMSSLNQYHLSCIPRSSSNFYNSLDRLLACHDELAYKRKHSIHFMSFPSVVNVAILCILFYMMKIEYDKNVNMYIR